LKTLKKVVVYFLATLGVLLTAFVVSIFLFKDRIIQQFVHEVNKSLATPVKIGKIDVSAWGDFPNLAIVLTDVYVEDSYPGEYPLLTAGTISFYLNPIEVYHGNYAIRGLFIAESETQLKVDEKGVDNYTILKKSDGTGNAVSFDLRNVKVQDAKVVYWDKRSRQHHIFLSKNLTASVHADGNLYDIRSFGDITTEQIGIGTQIYLKRKSWDVNSSLLYNDSLKNLIINPSTLSLSRASFALSGRYDFRDRQIIDIAAKGRDTNIHTLLSLFPEETAGKFSKYQSDGGVYFNLNLKGEISDRKSPFISVSFGCKDTRLSHPDYPAKIEHANLEGSFATASLNDLSRAELFLKGITGELDGRAFKAELSIANFDDPTVSGNFKGELDAASILQFYPFPRIEKLEGSLRADISIDGQLSLLKNKSTAQQVKTQGTIEMSDIQAIVGKPAIHVNNLNGVMQFNRNDLALSNVTGKLENSDFKLNGFFKNVVTFLLFDDQPIGIETDLQSQFLDLDELFSIGFSDDQSEEFHFFISPQLHLNFNCDIRAMKYKKFRPRHVKGDLIVRNQTAVSKAISFEAMGGEWSLNGIVDAANTKAIDVSTTANLKGIHVDSLFYVFENFHQDFLKDKNLKGLAFADVSLEMKLNEKLKLYPETLISDISVSIQHGELNDFEPLQGLNKYLDDEGLSHLRFAELKNDIHIENKTIFIPLMKINTNVTNIELSGTHTFDQHLDYRVMAPLRNRKKVDTDEAFGSVEDDGAGHLKVFLKITGTTDQYEVHYDKAAVKKKIASDIKKEVQELRDAFKLKGKEKKKEVELEKDDYFDWDKN
jgi:uncharacterized protein involved in outer membrane biogenesis